MKESGLTRRAILLVSLAGALSLAVSRMPKRKAHADEAAPPVVTIHLVHRSRTDVTPPPTTPPKGYKVVTSGMEGEADYMVEIRPILTNEDFENVGSGFDQYTNEPIVTFQLKPQAAKRLAKVTRDHVGRAMAIIIDGSVVSAPMILTEITGGEGVISGNFTVQEVADLVARMTGKPAE